MRQWIPFFVLLLVAIGAALWIFGRSSTEPEPVPERQPVALPEPPPRARVVPRPRAPKLTEEFGEDVEADEIVEAYVAASTAVEQGLVRCTIPEELERNAQRVTLGGLIRQWEEGDRVLGFAPTTDGAGFIHGVEPEHAYRYTGATPGRVVDCEIVPTAETTVRIPVTWDLWDDTVAFRELARSLGYVRGTCLDQRTVPPADYRDLTTELVVVRYEGVPCTVTLGDTVLTVTDSGSTPASVHFDSAGVSPEVGPRHPPPQADPEAMWSALDDPGLSPAAREVLEGLAEDEAQLAEKAEQMRAYHDNESVQRQQEWRQRVLQQLPRAQPR